MYCGKVRTRTLANLSQWPDAKVEALRRVLEGATLMALPERLAAGPPGRVAAAALVNPRVRDEVGEIHLVRHPRNASAGRAPAT